MGYFGFHVIQSFAEGEVTPELAHKIGVKLAEELWGDRFEVIVTTHLNTNHIHNHFCLNSVSFKDGKKYYDNHESYALMRDTSDRLCEEYNLSIIKEAKCKKSNINYTNFLKSNNRKSDYYIELKDDIDYAIEQAYSYNDFLNIMKKMDYEVENRAGKLSVRKSNRKRNTRIARVFGNEYEIKRINERIFETESIRLPFPEVRSITGVHKYNSRKKFKSKMKITGVRALYFRYCYLLKVYPKKKQRISKELREEIKKMDKISKEARFLDNNKIQTEKELFSYKTSSIIKRKELKSKKENLWKKTKRVKSENEKQQIEKEIKEITVEIKKINEEIKFIENIESRIPKIKDNIKEVTDEETKKNEKERKEQEYGNI